MNITELKGEKTIQELARRLVAAATPATDPQREINEEKMEAALLRINPHLGRIGELQEGTPILIPQETGTVNAGAPQDNPLMGLAEEWLRRGELALERVRVTLEDSVVQAKTQSEKVQTWLKSDEAKTTLGRAPELKEIFQRGGVAAKTLPKEQAAFVATETKSLSQVQSALKDFLGAAREKPASAAPPPDTKT